MTTVDPKPPASVRDAGVDADREGDGAEPRPESLLVSAIDPAAIDPESFGRSWTVLTPSGQRRPGAGAAATRRLLFAWSKRELRSRYRDSGFRGLWNLVQPVTILIIYSFVFTQIFGADGGGLPYLSMAWAGIVVWQFVQQGVQMGMWSFIYEAGTLPKIWYPRIVIPLTPATAALMDLGVGALLIAGVALIQGIRPTVALVALPIPLLLIVIWVYGVSLIVAPAAVFIRDLTTIVPLMMRLGFFTSPVMYPVSQVPQQFQWLFDLNPISVAITGVRDTMLAGVWPDWELLAVHIVAALVLLGCGIWYLRRVEHRLVDAL
jgi:lipopolysaccharide transport system permease protein